MEQKANKKLKFNYRFQLLNCGARWLTVIAFISVERKRIDDLAASIKDNRYKDQKKRLKETATYTPFFLIGKQTQKMRK